MWPVKYNQTGSAGKGSVQGQATLLVCVQIFAMFPIVVLFSDTVRHKKQLRIENRYHSYRVCPA